MELCVLIPAHNEQESIIPTVTEIEETLAEAGIPHNILVINDHSDDETVRQLEQLATRYAGCQYLHNQNKKGFGNAIRFGLDRWQGELITLCMADGAEYPGDIVRYYRQAVESNSDCVFGSRFIKGGATPDYPRGKLVVNRMANQLVRLLFFWKYDDFTNAFKLYSRDVINRIQPLRAEDFSITLELSMKAIAAAERIAIIPVTYRNRKKGASKLSLWQNFPSFLRVLLEQLSHKRKAQSSVSS